MGRLKIEVDKYICERCSHEWFSRTPGDPIVCPHCKSPYWDKPRQNPLYPPKQATISTKQSTIFIPSKQKLYDDKSIR
jgi:DNA-directed RNA polymerase subunit RPC12/RpoP